jgi:hypothetical protein
MRVRFYNRSSFQVDEIEADPAMVFIRLNVYSDVGGGIPAYAQKLEIPFVDFCELVRAQIDKPTKTKVKAA